MLGKSPGDQASAARLLSGWGRTAPSLAEVLRIATEAEAEQMLRSPGPRGLIARGLGRAYGDAAQNAGGRVLDMRGLTAAGSPDARGRVTVAAGLSLGELIDGVLPQGWLPAVVPGTRHVTIGGAIAADIHGKNHHHDGCFSRHVEWIDLLTPRGERVRLDPNSELFAATAGGMGLTGVIVQAHLRLTPIETAWMTVHTTRLRDLDEALAEMSSRDHIYRYSVAWIDCLARGAALGRSVLFRGDHAPAAHLSPAQRSRPAVPLPRPRLTAPPCAPAGLLRRSTVAGFNEVYFRRAPRVARERIEPLHSFFFPLDAVEGWNRLYGSRGLLQYQLVVPFGAETALRGALELLGGNGAPAFLAVLKRFGGERGQTRSAPGLSFPIGGWTLALDLPAHPELAPVLGSLDALVAEAGGRVYLAKDSRLRPELLADMYPELGAWQRVRAEVDPSGVMRSDLARRLALSPR